MLFVCLLFVLAAVAVYFAVYGIYDDFDSSGDEIDRETRDSLATVGKGKISLFGSLFRRCFWGRFYPKYKILFLILLLFILCILFLLFFFNYFSNN